ncbi:MAG: twin-arginine translocase TatA/TatE family subunit [Archangium sp.]
MFGIQPGELIMLVIIVAIVFSASRMGALGNAIGKFVYSFKKASAGEGFVDGKVTRVEKPVKTVEGEVIKRPSDDQR